MHLQVDTITADHALPELVKRGVTWSLCSLASLVLRMSTSHQATGTVVRDCEFRQHGQLVALSETRDLGLRVVTSVARSFFGDFGHQSTS